MVAGLLSGRHRIEAVPILLADQDSWPQAKVSPNVVPNLDSAGLLNVHEHVPMRHRWHDPLADLLWLIAAIIVTVHAESPSEKFMGDNKFW